MATMTMTVGFRNPVPSFVSCKNFTSFFSEQEITKAKSKSTRTLALSSIANSYWQRHRSELKDQVR